MAVVAKVVCLLVAFMVAAAPAAEAAFQCGVMTLDQLIPCLSYLKGSPDPSNACCGGVRALNAMAQTPKDRQAACVCLTNYAGSIPGINAANAASLPSKCGINVPFPISPKTDCSKIN